MEKFKVWFGKNHFTEGVTGVIELERTGNRLLIQDSEYIDNLENKVREFTK